jgi:hypothetical protein
MREAHEHVEQVRMGGMRSCNGHGRCGTCFDEGVVWAMEAERARIAGILQGPTWRGFSTGATGLELATSA